MRMSLPGGAAEDDVVLAGVLQVVRVRPDRGGVVADDQRRDLDAVDASMAAASGRASAVERPGR